MGWLQRLWGIAETDVDVDDAVADEDGSVVGDALGEGMVDCEITCAWCLAEQGLPFGEGSHGICDWHATQVRDAQRARHAW